MEPHGMPWNQQEGRFYQLFKISSTFDSLGLELFWIHMVANK